MIAIIALVVSALSILWTTLWTLYVLRHDWTLTTKLTDAVVNSVATLKPGNRYIITFPDIVTEKEFGHVSKQLSEYLQLNDADIRVALLSGECRIVEFS
jgi:hypothetical protein